CGSGNYVSGSDTGSSFKCVFPDGLSNTSVQVSADDGDGGTGSDSHAVTVNNVDPTVTLSNSNTYTWPESASAERTVNHTASAPAGANDPLTKTINCGSGNYVSGSDSGSSFKCVFPDGLSNTSVQ